MARIIDLFEEREESIYNKNPIKNQSDEEPYIYIPLNSSEPMNAGFETRANPASISTRRDIRRMLEFSTSTKGLIFLGKQQLLQSGNTFAETRLYNPANIQIHSIPFIHEKRHISLGNDIFDLFLGPEENETVLQKETVEELSNESQSPALRRARSRKYGILYNNPPQAENFGQSLGGRLKRIGKNILDQLVSPITRTISGIGAQLNGAQGDGRPETRIGRLNRSFYDLMAEQHADKHWTRLNPAESLLNFSEEVRRYKDQQNKNISIGLGPGASYEGQFFRQTRYYKDYQQIQSELIKSEDDDSVDRYDSDSIDVLFHVSNFGTPERIRFRAMISELNEQIDPSYSENKYVGRYETFYMYDKVIRELSFQLRIHAFSAEELERVRQKMEFLTTLAYPKNTDNYLTPQIFEITIGDIYRKQPCILTSLAHNIENDISWDIDKQSPMGILSSINLRLIDKHLYSYNVLRNREFPPFTGIYSPGFTVTPA